MIHPSKIQLQATFAKKGYKFFGDPMPFDLNIVGIRADDRVAGKFDDLVGVLCYDSKIVWREYWFPATVDSGDFYLRKPLHKDGTAVMLEGQYRGAYKLGIHGRTWASGGYEALEQVSPMRYVRDGNLDNKIDTDGRVFEAVLKTNIHRAYPNKVAEFIGKYSAGCQVIQNPADFEILLALCRQSVAIGFPNSFTYTLLNERELQ